MFPRPSEHNERELKYVLSETGYRRLWATLRLDARTCTYRRHVNRYYSDPGGSLAGARLMVRLRLEYLLSFEEQTPNWGPASPQQVVLTFKEPGRATVQPGEEDRPEHEFDVTREWQELLRRFGVDEPDLNALPRFYRHYVVERWGKQIGLDSAGTDFLYDQRAEMTNYRLTCGMSNGLCLELDRAIFPTRDGVLQQYELEVEHGGSTSPALRDEYIHDKMARLDIPVVLIGYPSKVQRALAYAEQLSPEERAAVLRQVASGMLLAEQQHITGCARCADHRRSLEPGP